MAIFNALACLTTSVSEAIYSATNHIISLIATIVNHTPTPLQDLPTIHRPDHFLGVFLYNTLEHLLPFAQNLAILSISLLCLFAIITNPISAARHFYSAISLKWLFLRSRWARKCHLLLRLDVDYTELSEGLWAFTGLMVAYMGYMYMRGRFVYVMEDHSRVQAQLRRLEESVAAWRAERGSTTT